MDDQGVDWLHELLASVQLDQFFVRIRDELQVSRLQHFDYVQPEDLEKIGMSKPAAKRLMDVIKRRRLKSKITKFLPVGRLGTIKKSSSSTGQSLYTTGNQSQAVGVGALTCLIQVRIDGRRPFFERTPQHLIALATHSSHCGISSTCSVDYRIKEKVYLPPNFTTGGTLLIIIAPSVTYETKSWQSSTKRGRLEVVGI